MNELTLLSIAVTLFVIILVIAGVFTFLKSIVHRLDGDIYTTASIVALSIMFAVFLIRILSDRILSFITYYFM